MSDKADEEFYASSSLFALHWRWDSSSDPTPEPRSRRVSSGHAPRHYRAAYPGVPGSRFAGDRPPSGANGESTRDRASPIRLSGDGPPSPRPPLAGLHGGGTAGVRAP